MACSSWPEAKMGYVWGCRYNVNATENGEWIELDRSMHISQTTDCESLCHQQNTYGCCFLGEEYGCFWKKFSVAGYVGYGHGYTSVAVTCNISGTSV